MAIEIVGGIIAHSIAVLSDAAHMLSDVAGFAVSLFAAWAVTRKSHEAYSFGYHRVEILGAFASVLAIWAVTGALVWEAIMRIMNPEPVNGKVMFIVACAGIAFNIVIALVLGEHHVHGPGGQCHGHDHGHGHGHGHARGHSHSHCSSRAASVAAGAAGPSNPRGGPAPDPARGHSHGHPGHQHDEQGNCIVITVPLPAPGGGPGGAHRHGSRAHAGIHTIEAVIRDDHHEVPVKVNISDVGAAGSSSTTSAEPSTHAHGHDHPHDHDHDHDHDHGHGHSSDEEAGGGHAHEHDGGCGHEHEHGREHGAVVKAAPAGAAGGRPTDGHGHDHDHEHGHSSDDDSHDHDHGHGHGHDHGHDHHDHGHGHGHGHGDNDHNINLRSAVLHVIGDLLQSIGVAIAGALIWWKQDDARWQVADPICTFIFALLVMMTTRTIIVDIWHTLMERTPQHVDLSTVTEAMALIEGIADVHDLHVWNISVGLPVLTAHVHIVHEADADAVLKNLEAYVRGLGINHSTIQICNPLGKAISVSTT